MPWFDFDKDPGRGNLNVRAYIASIVGPKRAAHGQRVIKRAPRTRAVVLAKNSSKNKEVIYVEVWVPNQSIAGGARVRFDSSGSMGETADLVTLGAFADNQSIDRYRAVLLPNEELYAQVISDEAGNPLDNISLVVSKVTF